MTYLFAFTTVLLLIIFFVQRSIYGLECVRFKEQRDALLQDRSAWQDQAAKLQDKIDQWNEEDTATLKEEHAQQLAALSAEHAQQITELNDRLIARREAYEAKLKELADRLSGCRDLAVTFVKFTS